MTNGTTAVATQAELDEKVAGLIREAGLCRPENRFFEKAQSVRSVDPGAAFVIARHWEAVTKAFMFTTISSLGVMAQGFAAEPAPDRDVLGAFQTA